MVTPISIPGPDDEDLRLRILLDHLAQVGRELGYDAGDDRGVQVGKREAAVSQEIGEQYRIFIRHGVLVGGYAPVGDQIGALEDTNYHVGVAGIYRQQQVACSQIRHLSAPCRLHTGLDSAV